MDCSDFDYYCDLTFGLFKCLVGLALTFSAIIGWPATRSLLRLIVKLFTRQADQKYAGSELWTKCSDQPSARREP